VKVERANQLLEKSLYRTMGETTLGTSRT